MIKRKLEQVLEEYLFTGKILIIYGARRVGKTTLVKSLLGKYNHDETVGYFNCELLTVKKQLESLSPHTTKKFFGEHKIIVLDEAQKVKNIGLVLKQLIDTFSDLQIIATGSSSFDLANKINEPLTGRAFEFILYPFSQAEVYQKDEILMKENLEKNLIYGMYPQVFLAEEKIAQKTLEAISSQYLYQDILELENIKKPDLLINILEMLALQLGNEVSTHELARKLRVSRDVIDRYIMLLEKAFVIFRLRAFSRNLRNEITKKQKIYFYDLGIRNAILNNYAPLRLRNDVGALWENFLIVERKKYLEIKEQPVNQFFWRTHEQKEIDYIEEHSGQLFAFEFKWSERKSKIPQQFLEAYKNVHFQEINQDNFIDFLEIKKFNLL